MTFRLVDQEKAHHPGSLLCRVLGVSRAGFYAWQSRPLSARAVADQALTEQICQVHRRSRATYGAPRVHAELRLDHGVHLGRKRVARLMRAAGLVGCHRRRRRGLTRRDPQAAPAPDLVERAFTAEAPDRLWTADVTYVPTWSGWLYLAVVLDVFSRRVVGWAMAEHLRTELVIDASTWPSGTGGPPRAWSITVIRVASQGSRGRRNTASLAFGRRLREAGLVASMGSVGDCFDNAVTESFFATLECELLHRRRFRTQVEARVAVFDYLEGFYNPRRRHSALGQLSPADFERSHQATYAAAQP
jgi:putative transposase